MPQDPAEIQRQIEATRAELAATVDQIADRVSPKRVAERGTAQVRARLEPDRLPPPVAKVTGFFGLPDTPRWDRLGGAAGVLALVSLLRRRRRRRRTS